MDFRLTIDGTTRTAVETARGRLLVGGVLFAACFFAISLRLFDLAVIHQGATALQLAGRYVTTPEPMLRADILDRNGVLLATNLDVQSLGAKPDLIRHPEATAAAIAAILPDLDVAALTDTLTSDAKFVWLKRGLTPEQFYALNRLGNPGLEFRTEQRRIYPNGRLTAHTVGFAGVDNDGLAGIERSLDDVMTSQAEPVVLSIDVRLQQIVRDELTAQLARFSAKAGGAVVLDAHSGEVLAMVSLPDFDPNQPGDADDEQRFNRASFGVYELGSVFKVFTLATALETGAAKMSSRYDATEPIKVSRFTINDYEGEHRVLTLPEVLLYSSNIGAAKIALDIGADTQRAYLGQLGLLTSTPIELPEQGSPIFPARWREVNTMTIGFGHGIAVTPVHLSSAIATVVNGGVYFQPTILRQADDQERVGTRVYSHATSLQMRELLRMVVAEGTGRRADAPGYFVGGKTGTAEKQVRGRYDRKALVSSFVAAFPMTDPRYVVMVMLDEPHGIEASYGRATGGWVAAPAVSRIVTRMAPLLGLLPAPGTNPDSSAAAAAQRLAAPPNGAVHRIASQ